MKKEINQFVVLKFLNFILFFFKTILFKKLKATPKKIAIFRPGNLGDLICAVPSFYSIRKKYPYAKIYLMTSQGSGNWGANEIFKENIFFDEIINYSTKDTRSLFDKIQFIKRLRLLEFDLWIDYGNQINTFFWHLRQIFLIKMFNVQSIWLDKCIYFTYFRIFQSKKFFFMNETTKLNNFVASNGVEIIDLPDMIMHDNYFENSVISNIKNFIVISIGSAQPLLNFWDEKKFTDLANYLSLSHQVVFIGSPSERKKADRIISRMKKKPINLVGKTSISNLFSILNRSKIVIGLDSGPQHIAALEGASVITITACWNFDNTWTPSGKGKIITLKPKKRSERCLLNKDRHGRRLCYNNPNCIESISTSDVIKAVNQIL